MEWLLQAHEVSFGADGKVLEPDRGDTQYCEDTKCQRIVHFRTVKMVSFVLCGFFHQKNKNKPTSFTKHL